MVKKVLYILNFDVYHLSVKLILLFSLFIPITFSFIILVISGELDSINRIIDNQMNSKKEILYGPVYSNQSRSYKLIYTNKKKPKIVILGTSRVMQFRNWMFNNQNDFYNAGGGITKLIEIEIFLEQLDIDNNPDLLILGLDQYFFNGNWDKNYYNTNYNFKYVFNPFKIIESYWRKTIIDFFKRKIIFDSLVNSNNKIGLNAKIYNQGFRRDGSYQYKKSMLNVLSQEYKNRLNEALNRIEKGIVRFQYSECSSDTSFLILNNILKICKERNINVISILLPYADTV